MTEDELIEPTGDFDELAAFRDSDDAREDWMPGSVLDGYLAGIVAPGPDPAQRMVIVRRSCVALQPQDLVAMRSAT
jgi:hypothetical protein